MRKPIVAGNWKMNGSREQNAALVAGVLDGAEALNDVDVAVCPPHVYVASVGGLLDGSNVGLGAQDMSAEASGAHTGETAGEMLLDLDCQYVILGHSERRADQQESDALIAAKFVRAIELGLTPILCVGETLAEREGDQTAQVVGRQLNAVLDAAGVEAFAKAVLAYEPVWAIGTGKTASPDQAQAVHAELRALVAKRDGAVADGLRIQYGGSVKPGNAAELFAQPDIDGGLIGGAALNAEDFVAICAAAQAA